MAIAGYIGFYIITGPLLILILAGYWKLFEKAGRPGWEALIPVYHLYIMLKLSQRPLWLLLLLFIPVINFIISIGILIDFIKSFGKVGIGQITMSVLLPFILFPSGVLIKAPAMLVHRQVMVSGKNTRIMINRLYGNGQKRSFSL
jgi:signal peptidase I